MTGTTVRLLIVAAFVVAMQAAAGVMRQGLKPAHVELPGWELEDMPLRLGPWRGEDIRLESQDPRIVAKIGAEQLQDRAYRNPDGQSISLHTALFTEYDVGVFHSPMNCYRASGWQLADETSLRLQGSNGLDVSISLSTWQRDAERVLVAYWYQLQEYVILSRYQLGTVRWKLRGSESWPPLIKVLMQTSCTDNPEEDEQRVREFAEHVFSWLARPRASDDVGGPGA